MVGMRVRGVNMPLNMGQEERVPFEEGRGRTVRLGERIGECV